MEDRPPSDPVPPSGAWTPPPPPPIEPPAPSVLPWEQPGVPWLTGLVETAKLLFTRPREAFERMPLAGDLLRPLLFAIVFGWIGAIFGSVWNAAFKSIMPHNMHYGTSDVPAAWLPIFALFAPIFVVVGLFISAAIYHVMLMVVGGARSGFAATLRVLCYAQAPQVFQVLPFCGALIAGVGAILLMIQGLAVAHRISIGKAALAVLLPIVLCCGCLVAFFMTLGAAIFSGLAHGMGGQ